MAEEDSIETTILGRPFKAKGVNGIALLIMALALSVALFLLWDRTIQSEIHLETISSQHATARERQTQQLSTEHTAIVSSMKALQEVNEAISEALNEQNYLLLADEKERQEIKKRLKRPESLSKKLDRSFH